MVDTVSLMLNEKDFRIIDHNRFSPSTENLFVYPYIKVTGKSPFKAHNNSTKKDVQLYGYLPRLTLMKALRRGGFSITLKIEFSVPKMLYGNNFDEVIEPDFGEICWKLKDLVKHMGVEISDVKLISKANVSSIHYSKNIILTDYTTPTHYLKELSRININQLLDFNQTDFRNEGHALKYRSNNYEAIFYDKLEDLKKAKISDKRAIEKDNGSQMSFFEARKPLKPFEVLRLEVRIGNRKKLKQVLNKHLFKLDLNFEKLFSREISRKILNSLVHEVEKAYPKLLKTVEISNERLCINLQLNNPKVTYSQLLKYLGAKVLIEEIGVRGFRQVTKRYGDKQWYRLNQGMNSLVIGPEAKIFENVNNAIREFKQIKLENYKDYM